jgi:hypothetical protein
VPLLFEADEKHALAMLRHDALRVYDLGINVVFEMVSQRFPNDSERVAFVVPREVFDVFQHESVGPVAVNQFLQSDPSSTV